MRAGRPTAIVAGQTGLRSSPAIRSDAYALYARRHLKSSSHCERLIQRQSVPNNAITWCCLSSSSTKLSRCWGRTVAGSIFRSGCSTSDGGARKARTRRFGWPGRNGDQSGQQLWQWACQPACVTKPRAAQARGGKSSRYAHSPSAMM